MFKTIADAFRVKEIRNKIFITLGLLLIYRLGCWLPVPGINLEAFRTSVEGQDFLSLISSVSGGALSNGAILALGISPYISASIIIQLLTIAIPSLERLSKMGEEGKKRIGLYNKICALVLAIVQAVAIVISYSDSLNTVTLPAWVVGTMVVLILVAGSMFTYWLGEKITAVGIANGVFILLRYREQWAAWYIVTFIEIALNIMAGQWILLVLKAGYLTNTTYGYIKWTKYIKDKQANVEKSDDKEPADDNSQKHPAV